MRQIDADALIKWVQKCGEKCPTLSVEKLFNTIKDAPTIDPVKHGKWLKIGDCDTVQCSECFDDFDYIDGLCYLCHGRELPNYCPNCGAKMDSME